MNLETALEKIAAIPWFTNLGNASATESIVAVSDLAQWSAFAVASTEAEFGLEHDEVACEVYPFSVMEWLPTSNDQPDPVHGTSLLELAGTRGAESAFTAAKIAGFKAACKSQRSAIENPILRVGASDNNYAALAGGRYACRMAVAEAALGQAGFWCDMVDIYCRGNWPMALLPSRKILVL